MSLDVSNFDTSNVTDMSWMFSVCYGLTSLDVTHFDTSKVTNMYGMFNSCDGLTSLDVTHFDTSNVTSMWWMFAACDGLTSLDVSHFDTSKVTNMYGMFAMMYAPGLTSLDLSHFDTSNVTNMNYMFEGCTSLKNLSLADGFNVDNVIYFDAVFKNVTDLTIYVDEAAKGGVDAALAKLGFTEGNGRTTSIEPLTARQAKAGDPFYATYYNSVASMKVPEGTTAYTGVFDGTNVVYSALADGIIPKGNAVMLIGGNADVTLDVVEDKGPKSVIEENVLLGVDVDTKCEANRFFTFGAKNGVAAFYRYTGTTLGAHKAFLDLDTTADAVGIRFADDTDGISDVQTDAQQGISIYNMNGQRLAQPQRGLNIINGQKVIVK